MAELHVSALSLNSPLGDSEVAFDDKESGVLTYCFLLVSSSSDSAGCESVGLSRLFSTKQY